MRFLNPAGLWLLLGIPILILIYLIKSQHEDRPVSSTYIWKLSSRFMKKKLPLQRIRKFLLFLLQLFMIITTALLVARPAVFNGEICEYIAILDLSASMQTADDSGTTRLDLAREQIVELAKQTENGHKITVITATDNAAYLVQSTTSQGDVEFALEDIEATLGGCNPEKALELARPICESSKNASVIFYTDCNYEDTQNITVVNVNQNEWNLAVENLSLTEGTDESLLTGTITSYNRDATVTVGLKIDGEIESAATVTCQSNVPATVQFITEPLGSNYTAEIYVEEADGLTADNTYILCSESRRNLRVLLLSQTPFYLNSALEALGNCQVTAVTSPEEITFSGYDLYLFDNIFPDSYPTDGAIIQFGTGAMPTGIGFGELISAEGPFSTVSDLTDDLYKDLELNDTVLSKYTPLSGDSRWKSVFECAGKSVCMTTKTAYGMPFTIFSFDLHDSNLALQSGFVILMRNLLGYSVPPLIQDNDFSIGEIVELNELPSADALCVQYPDGKIETISTINRQGSIVVDSLGLHTAFMTIGVGGEAADFFVHIPETENAVQEGGTIEWSYTANPDVSTAPTEAFTEIWFWLAAALLLLILLEWGVYYYEQY